VKVSQIVEGVLFASDAPLKAEEIARADESLDEDLVEEAIRDLRALYDESGRAFQVVELGEGYQILTRPELAPYLERFDTVPRLPRLSGPALETLAIIAYRQPIGRIEIEYIRGVGAAGVIRTLQDRRTGGGGGPVRGAGAPPPLPDHPAVPGALRVRLPGGSPTAGRAPGPPAGAGLPGRDPGGGQSVLPLLLRMPTMAPPPEWLPVAPCPEGVHGEPRA
jgi:segregation and condensation protein B